MTIIVTRNYEKNPIFQNGKKTRYPPIFQNGKETRCPVVKRKNMQELNKKFDSFCGIYIIFSVAVVLSLS